MTSSTITTLERLLSPAVSNADLFNFSLTLESKKEPGPSNIYELRVDYKIPHIIGNLEFLSDIYKIRGDKSQTEYKSNTGKGRTVRYLIKNLGIYITKDRLAAISKLGSQDDLILGISRFFRDNKTGFKFEKHNQKYRLVRN